MEPFSVPREHSAAVAGEPELELIGSKLKALLASKSGIDEHLAKQLRKQWAVFDTGSVAQPQLDEITQLFASLRSRIHAQVELRNAQFTELTAQLEHLKEQVQAGDLKTIPQQEAELIEKLNRIVGLSVQRRQRLIEELDQLRPKIQEMTAWRHWGTGQARQKVIREIRNLHETEKDLKKAAQRIQQARKQWRDWDQSDAAEHALYREFDRVCTQAYAPCKRYFEQQRQQRQKAAQVREQCCQLLETELAQIDWHSADWKAVQRLVQAQKTRWRHAGTVEHKLRQVLQQRFDRIIAEYEAPLERERARCLKRRQTLIAELDRLAQSEQVKLITRQLTELKKQWVVSVACARKQEQDLWQQFTQACDRVYQQRDALRQTETRQQQQNLQAREAICVQIETFTERDGAAESVLAAQLVRWQAQWQECGGAPVASRVAIEKRYRSALHQVQQWQQQTAAHQQQATEALLLVFYRHCTELEKNLFESADAAPSTPDMAKIEHAWQSLDALPPPLQQQMEQRFQRASKAYADPAEREQLCKQAVSNLDQLQQLLLQLEIAANVPSPAEFARQRMALQVNRLAAGVGKATTVELLPPGQLVTAILSLGAVPPAEGEQAMQRLQQCRQALDTTGENQ